MPEPTEWQPSITIPTFVASALSAAATAVVVLMWLQSRGQKDSLRYALVMNLTFAEFINAINNLISGSYVVVTHHDVLAGVGCQANGWVGQVSVQAGDFSILAIAILTLLTFHFQMLPITPSRHRNMAICFAVWIIPLITATIALAMNKMTPVSGNWCWISNDPPVLRYFLTHDWRFAIFIIIIFIYSHIFLHVRRRVRQRNQLSGDRTYSFTADGDLNPVFKLNFRDIHADVMEGKVAELPADCDAPCLPANSPPKRGSVLGRLKLKPRIRVHQTSVLDQEMRHWLWMSMYPLLYIMVWIPGIANRFVEMTGHTAHWLVVLQATTQLTGFVNAMAYGFREHRCVLQSRASTGLKRWVT